mgnify:CR=1 FL=1
MRRLIAVPCLLVVSVAVAAPVPKVDTSKSWVGKQVIVKDNNATMKVKTGGGEGDYELHPIGVLSPVVLVETADAIEISWAGRTGTVPKADVIGPPYEVEFFTKQIDEKPTAELYLRRAGVYKVRGDADDALADVNKAIDLSPSHTAFHHRGLLHLDARDFEAAAADFERCVELEPENAFGYRGRGEARELSGKVGDALADYTKANELAPEPWTHTSVGRLLTVKKEYAKAEAEYDAALKLNPKHMSAYLGRAGVRFEQKKDADADADLLAVEKLFPNEPQVQVSRASAAFRRGRYADADRLLAAALRLNPKHAGALNLRAWLLAVCPDAEFRDGAKAVELATEACKQTKWKAYGFLDTLAAASAEAGKFDDAVKWQKQAMEDANLMAREGEELKKRLEAYTAKKPHREEPKWKR